MDLYSIKTIKALLKEHNTTPKDRLGQNFLLEKRVAAKMLGAAEVSANDMVLEIGPGIGTLTLELAKNAQGVVAVEKDPAMIEILKKTLKAFDNIQIVEGDILNANLISFSFPHLNGVKFKVVANLPYSITSPVIRMFLEAENKPEVMALMVQKEVAQRICAKPPDMSLLAVSVQFYAQTKIMASVSKGSFWPRPKVDSAIIKIVPNKEKPPVEPERFFRVVKAGFKQPRKQLINNLASGLKLSKQQAETWLSQAGIKPTQRAETLSVEDWTRLAKCTSCPIPSN